MKKEGMVHVGTLLKNEKGAAAVEFALVALVFISTLLFILTAGLLLYFNMSLDFATAKASRQIMTGYIQKNSVNQSQFVTQYVCPNLPPFMNCSDVIVNVYTATEAAQPGGYYAFANSGTTALNIPQLSNANASFSVGIQQSYEYVEIIYPFTALPSLVSKILGGGSTYNGSPAFLLISTAAFKNEAY